MATIHVDGKQYEVDGADNLLQACLNLGLDIPYFCWHPALGSVGACRQCAVKSYRDESDKTGRIVMSCMRSEEHTSELQSLMRISYAVFCLKKKNKTQHQL